MIDGIRAGVSYIVGKGLKARSAGEDVRGRGRTADERKEVGEPRAGEGSMCKEFGAIGNFVEGSTFAHHRAHPKSKAFQAISTPTRKQKRDDCSQKIVLRVPHVGTCKEKSEVSLDPPRVY